MYTVLSFNWKSGKSTIIAQFNDFVAAENFIYRKKFQFKNPEIGYAIESENETWEY